MDADNATASRNAIGPFTAWLSDACVLTYAVEEYLDLFNLEEYTITLIVYHILFILFTGQLWKLWSDIFRALQRV